jgi:hypothetical protein
VRGPTTASRSGTVGDEPDREFAQRHARLFDDSRETVDDLELALVGHCRDIEPRSGPCHKDRRSGLSSSGWMVPHRRATCPTAIRLWRQLFEEAAPIKHFARRREVRECKCRVQSRTLSQYSCLVWEFIGELFIGFFVDGIASLVREGRSRRRIRKAMRRGA